MCAILLPSEYLVMPWPSTNTKYKKQMKLILRKREIRKEKIKQKTKRDNMEDSRKLKEDKITI